MLSGLEIKHDGNKVTFTAHTGTRIVKNPGGLTPGKYLERVGFGVPENERLLYGPLELIVAIDLGGLNYAYFPNGARWWRIVDARVIDGDAE